MRIWLMLFQETEPSSSPTLPPTAPMAAGLAPETFGLAALTPPSITGPALPCGTKVWP